PERRIDFTDVHRRRTAERDVSPLTHAAVFLCADMYPAAVSVDAEIALVVSKKWVIVRLRAGAIGPQRHELTGGVADRNFSPGRNRDGTGSAEYRALNYIFHSVGSSGGTYGAASPFKSSKICRPCSSGSSGDAVNVIHPKSGWLISSSTEPCS